MKVGFVLPLLAGSMALAAACGAGSSKTASSSSPVPVASAAAVAASPTTLAQAQPATPATNPVDRLNGTVQAVDGNTVTLKEGGSFTLGSQTAISKRVPASAADLQAGKAVAVTAKKQTDNVLLASAVTVFPTAPSATFFRQFPLGDGNLMTNATIDKISGNSFTVSFPGGGGQVTLAPDAQITTIGKGTSADIKAGTMVAASVLDGVAQSVSIL